MIYRSLLILCLFPGVLHAFPDPLLEQLSRWHEHQGPIGMRALAESQGILVREEQGQLLIPVLVERSVARERGFPVRVKQGGGRLDGTSRSWARILVPAGKLNQFFSVFSGKRLHAPVPHKPSSIGYGAIISESVALTAADGYQAGNLTGSGIKVAVVDLGFSRLNDAIAAGELPPDALSHAVDFSNTGLQSGTRHGTGVAEHVADMAPGAEIHYLKVSDQMDLENAAGYIASNNIRIANHSVMWVLASYYDGSGPINGIINVSASDNGVFWTVASGNSAQKHWRGGWQDNNGNNLLDFSGTNDLMGLSGTSSTVSVFLNWNQYGANNKTNIDLYVHDKNGDTVAYSTTEQSRLNDPLEYVSFPYVASQAPYTLLVEHVRGSTSGLDLTLFSFNHNFEHYVAASSVADPACANGAFTVGAVNQSVWTNTSPAIRSYSSQGPTTDGRLKPNLVAPDGTQSLTYGTSSGTSFSAPTVAGAAALLLQQDPARTPADLSSLLQNQAIDAGSPGTDYVFGYGQLQLPWIDSDSDQLSNVEEILLGTDPLAEDTDDDGLSDYDEVATYGSDPLLEDTDGDGLGDGYETFTYGTDPLTSNRGDLAPRGAPDGVINAADYLILLRLVTGEITATSSENILGELNGHGGLDAGDLVLLSRVVQGQIPLP